MPDLPGKPGPAMTGLWAQLSDEEREALWQHLVGGTSAQWLAQTLREAGHQIGSTSIKDWRRTLPEDGV